METIVNRHFIVRTLVLLAAVPLSVQAYSPPKSGADLDDGNKSQAFPDEDVPEGFMIIEGDIQVPVDFYDQLETASVAASNLWPDGIVYFEWDANVDSDRREDMRLAMQEWIDVADISFVPRTGWEPSWIHIQNSSGNNSPVGIAPGQRTINIFNWNERFIMAHELAHTLGVWHEQSRPDRDTACDGGPCVIINLANVCQNCCSGQPCNSNFLIQPGADTFGPYDFDSVMHYDQCAFSTNEDCPDDGSATITVPPPNEDWQDEIGQIDHLSDGDIDGMQSLYGTGPTIYIADAPDAGDGTLNEPFTSFVNGMGQAGDGARVFVRSDSYFAVGTYARWAMVYAYEGTVTLGN